MAYRGQLQGGTHDQRVVALAGALAECGVTRIEAEISYCTTVGLEARVTDLPGFLTGKDAPILRAKGTTIAILTDAIEWCAHDADVRDAMDRAQASLK